MTRPSKAEHARQRIFAAAITLFVEKGYEQTTMGDIAAAADCPMSLLHRCYDSKEALVIALYERSVEDAEAAMAALPPGPLAERFTRTLRGILTSAEPYREIYSGFFGSAMNPRAEAGVLGSRTREVRLRMKAAFVGLARSASDAPRAEAQIEQIGALLYVLHLLLLLFWINDTSDESQATQQLLDFTQEALTFIRGALVLPPVTKAIARLVGILEQVFLR